MTSNIGLKEVQDFGTKIGFNDSEADAISNSKSIIEKNLKKTFKPEFINRLDEIVYFNYLNESDITKILCPLLNGIVEKLENAHDEIREKGMSN